MKKTYLSAIALSLLFCAKAQAESPDAPPSPHSVYLGIGALGEDIGYAQQFSEHWSGRILLHTGGQGRSDKGKDIGGVHYKLKPKIGPGLSLLADYYPLKGSGLRLTAGLNFAKMESSLEGQADSYELNGHRYTSAEVGDLRGKQKFQNVQPYLGLGWESGGGNKPGWRFVSDLGLLYAGQAKASLAASGEANNAALRQDVQAERKDLKNSGLLVYLGLGAAYAF